MSDTAFSSRPLFSFFYLGGQLSGRARFRLKQWFVMMIAGSGGSVDVTVVVVMAVVVV